MRNVIQFDGIKFWVDENIIHCKLKKEFFKNYQKENIEEIFYNSISIVSNGNYMPILFNLENISILNSLKIFRLISNSFQMRRLVLPRIFLVQSNNLKLLLTLKNDVSIHAVTNKFFSDFDLAIKYCENDYTVFNNVSKQELV
nr:hypothetical protein [uncultured Psychroserpens sp.]